MVDIFNRSMFFYNEKKYSNIFNSPTIAERMGFQKKPNSYS